MKGKQFRSLQGCDLAKLGGVRHGGLREMMVAGQFDFDLL